MASWQGNRTTSSSWGATTSQGTLDLHPIHSPLAGNLSARWPNRNTESRRKRWATFLPESLHTDGDVNNEIRKRGIYQLPLYTGTFRVSGTFNKPDLGQWGVSRKTFIGTKPPFPWRSAMPKVLSSKPAYASRMKLFPLFRGWRRTHQGIWNPYKIGEPTSGTNLYLLHGVSSSRKPGTHLFHHGQEHSAGIAFQLAGSEFSRRMATGAL